MKNCNVHENVAGIEIENSFYADVFDNFATNNSGGILVSSTFPPRPGLTAVSRVFTA